MTDTHTRFLGNHALSAETLMMGYGYDPFLSERSLKPPGLPHLDFRVSIGWQDE